MLLKFSISLVALWSVFILLPDSTEGIVGGREAVAPPPDDPVVFVNRRGKSARILGTRDEKRYNFKGLRYAQPPVGELRFQRPRMYTLNGDIHATKYGSPCPQPKKGKRNVTMIVGKEDCLYLNVFTPELSDGGEGLPVAVWIHGGGFRVGSAAQYDAKHLVNKKMVIVTLQYRLGSLGYLSTKNGDQPGNAGLFDISMALRWVRDYIQFFGGNPRKVIVMGQGSGGSAAVLVGMSDMTKVNKFDIRPSLCLGYTHGVVAMSGTGLSDWTLDKEPKRTARSLTAAQKCPNTSEREMVKCLQKQPHEEIIKADSDIEEDRQADGDDVKQNIAGLQASGPVNEGEDDRRSLPSFVPREPLESMEKGKFTRVPLLTGVTKDETANAVNNNKKVDMRKKLKDNPKYLQEHLLGNLQSFTNVLQNGLLSIPGINQVANIAGGVANGLTGRTKRQSITDLVNKISPIKFDNYLKIANPGNLAESLLKAAEVTSDALFNFPAFLTANLWTKSGTPTYFYSFDHKGNASKGYNFLAGIPLVSEEDKKSSNSISHGDDLAYLFKPQTLEGEPIEGSEDGFTEEDHQVRDVFTDIISQFAHQIGQKRKGRASNPLLKEFNEKENNYISIQSKPKVNEGFRFCEMALWGGLTERLQSTSCKFLDGIGDTVQGIEQGFKNAVGGLNGMKSPLGGIGGGGSKQNSKPNNPIGGFIGNSFGGGADGDQDEEEMMQPVKKISNLPKNPFSRSVFG